MCVCVCEERESVCVRVFVCVCVCIYIHVYISVYIYMIIHKSAGTGWRRLIGCLKLQVIFRKRATNYRALWRKMTHEQRHPMGLRHPVDPLLQSGAIRAGVCGCVFVWERERERKCVYIYICVFL